MSNCTQGWSTVSELTIFPSCVVPSLADLSLRAILLIFASLSLVVQSTMIVVRRNKFPKQNSLVNTLIVFSTVQNLIMMVRPIIGLATGLRSVTDLAVALVTHISASMAADVAILFVYFEATLIHNSSMIKEEDWWYRHRRHLLFGSGALQTLLFVIGPILREYYPAVTLVEMFWVVVILISVTVIPYLMILGIIIYRKLQTTERRDEFKKLSRHILLTVLICSGLATSNCIIALISVTSEFSFTWVLIELAWIFDIFFNDFIFLVLMRKKRREVVVTRETDSK